MEEAIISAVLKWVIPLVIELLHKYGFINAAESLAAKTVDEVVLDVKSLKTYQQYPTGKNGQSS